MCSSDLYFFIPNILFEILDKYNGTTIDNVKSNYDLKFHEFIDEYFEFLKENDLIFFTSKPELFPRLDLAYESNKVISNVVIDYSKDSSYDMGDIFPELEELGVSSVQFRIFDSNEAIIGEIVELTKMSTINSIELILDYNHIDDFEKMIEVIKSKIGRAHV